MQWIKSELLLSSLSSIQITDNNNETIIIINSYFLLERKELQVTEPINIKLITLNRRKNINLTVTESASRKYEPLITWWLSFSSETDGFW